jgi:ATP phosphoribosyltransferase regulatory subunit
MRLHDSLHVAVFRALVTRACVAPAQEAELFRVLQAKDVPALRELSAGLDAKTREALLFLPQLYGGAEVLATARRRLPAYPELGACLDLLEAIGRQLSGEVKELCFDLAELRGYHYHSGVVFAAYAGARPEAIARGGRYDEVGRAFGRARPATGFTMDLRDLADMGNGDLRPTRVPPLPAGDAALQAEVERLRAGGIIVVVELPGHEANRAELGCEQQLVARAGAWKLEPLA